MTESEQRSGKPSCFASNPSYQAQAENDCNSCRFYVKCMRPKTTLTDTLSPGEGYFINWGDFKIVGKLYQKWHDVPLVTFSLDLFNKVITK